MYLVVDMFCYHAEEVGFVNGCGVKAVEPVVDTVGSLIVYMSLLSPDAGLHVVKVVLFGLFPSWHISLALELLCLEEVAGVILIGYG